MPSVTGMSVSSSKGKKSALQKRIDFFINEGTCTLETLDGKIFI
jgi:hypothetical protein